MQEAFQAATKSGNLMVIGIDGELKTRYEHFCEKLPKFSKQLWQFDEAGTVKIGYYGKLWDNGAPCIFAGYPCNHNSDCFCMYSPKTKQVPVTKNVIWSKHMYYQKQEMMEV